MAYYPFNDNLMDESGNGHDGQGYEIKSTLDCFGNENSAYHFNGIDAYIEIPHSTELDFELEETFAISLLFKAEDVLSGLTDCDILSKWNSSHLDTTYSYGIRMRSQLSTDPGQISVARYDSDDLGCLNTGQVLWSQDSYLDDEWHHIVYQLTIDNEIEMYIDGILINSSED